MNHEELNQILSSIPETGADIYKPSVIVVDEEGKFLLIESKRKPGTWKTAGGRSEEGETVLECITRELEEELGIPADGFKIKRKIAGTGPTQSIDEDITVELDFFEVELTAKINFNYDENLNFGWFTREQMESGKVQISHQLKDTMLANF